MFDLQLSETEYLSSLKKILLHEFDSLYIKYRDQKIYAFALILDEHLIPQYTTLSTKMSLLNHEENRFQYLAAEDQWDISKWKYQTQNVQSLNLFSRKMAKLIQEKRSNITTIHSKDHFYRHILNFYFQAMDEVKNIILHRYQLFDSKIIFLVHQVYYENITIESIEYLNPPSSTLFEAIADLKSLLLVHEKNRLSSRLSRLDKDILIDLRQLLEIDPYNDARISQQAKSITSEPDFLDANLDIQKLIKDVALLTENRNYMTKPQILSRIQEFYIK